MPTPTAPGLSTRRLRRRGYLADTRTDVAQAPRSPGRNVRSRCRCSVFVCPAFCTTSRSWLRSSSTHEPSDPPHRAVFVSTSLKRRSLFCFRCQAAYSVYKSSGKGAETATGRVFPLPPRQASFKPDLPAKQQQRASAPPPSRLLAGNQHPTTRTGSEDPTTRSRRCLRGRALLPRGENDPRRRPDRAVSTWPRRNPLRPARGPLAFDKPDSRREGTHSGCGPRHSRQTRQSSP